MTRNLLFSQSLGLRLLKNFIPSINESIFILFLSCFFILSQINSVKISAQSQLYWQKPLSCDSLNTCENDFAPVWNNFEQQLYFNSEISGYSIFYISKLYDSLFSIPHQVRGQLNKPKNNQSFISFLSDDFAVFSTFIQTARRPYLNLFKINKKKQAWTDPSPIQALENGSFNSHPTISPDGSLMIFVSDRNSKFSETDLWVSFRDDKGNFSDPNSIDELNSQGNEITPFLLSKDTLFFASDGYEGAGGFDIFMSVNKDGLWQKPVPVKELNSEYNESDFTLLPNRICIFASDRPGGKGKLDLFWSKQTNKQSAGRVRKNIDLAMECNIKVITLKKYIEFTLYPIIPFISREFLMNLSVKGFKSRNEEFRLEFMNLNKIAAQMNKLKNSELTLSLFSEESFLNISRFKSAIKDFFSINGISENRIKFATNSTDTNWIKLEIDQADLLTPYEAGASIIVPEQKSLEFNLDARPKDEIVKWNCSIKSGVTTLDTIESEGKLPAVWNSKIENYVDQLWLKDTVIVEFSAEDVFMNGAKQQKPLLIEHHSHSTGKIFKLDNKYYELFFIIFPDTDINKISQAYNDYLKIIADSAANSKKIISVYFNDSDIQKKKATDLIELISSNLKNPVTIKTIYEESTPLQSLPAYLKKNYIEIRIEK
ncbi:MAG: hypothetical protein NT007_04895 [Candidatus Kapabacteria bacterium]|nr:hypothetical protein [Candidatus Kapabacteria bacterium]